MPTQQCRMFLTTYISWSTAWTTWHTIGMSQSEEGTNNEILSGEAMLKHSWTNEVWRVWSETGTVPVQVLENRSGTGACAYRSLCLWGTLHPGPPAAWGPSPQTPGSWALEHFRNTPLRHCEKSSRQRVAIRSRPSRVPAWSIVYLGLRRYQSV